jgi:hypothetical protein
VTPASNRTPFAGGTRVGHRALLISTHPLLRVRGGTFVSAGTRLCDNVNTWPVLAAPTTPPSSAPRSRADL